MFCVEREHCFILEIRWCNERIQLEWKCFTECGREHSSHGQRHKYEERCGFGRSFWCVTYLAFCIDLLYKTAIFGPFFDITPYHRSTIFLSLEQRNQIYIMDWKQMHTLLIKRYGSVMRARSSLFTRKCIWLKSNIMEMILIELYIYLYMYKINRKIIISIGMPLVLEWSREQWMNRLVRDGDCVRIVIWFEM